MLLETPALHLDPLWRLAAECAADPRPEALNLVLGVYRDATGASPVMHAVHAAEIRLAQQGLSKEYTSPVGNARFNAGIARLALRGEELVERTTAVQAVGGTGALRILLDMLRLTGPERTVHLGTPAYVNHPAILRAAGVRMREYVLERDGLIDEEAVLEVARTAAAGDVLLLQGSCHNPTGLSMSLALWDELAAVMADRGVVPLIDHAYFGLGDGLDEDFEGMRRMLRVVPDALVAVSASKAWGLYNERTGCALTVTADPARGEYVRGILEVVARAAYSQAPSHGARVVAEVLDDEDLRADWQGELEGMRLRLGAVRDGLADRLRGERFAHLRDRRGMFLTLPLGEDEMARLRVDHGIYGVPSGRINLAALPDDRIEDVAAAIAAVG